jgi:FKBP-type peptidyl-prolyl cis-trans isomerase 2
MIKNGSTVQVHYTGKLTDGTTFDSSVGRSPFKFQIGSNEVIPGFEQGLMGKIVGEKVTISIPFNDAYGEVRNDLIVNVPKNQLPGEVEVGQTLQASNEGQSFNVEVKEVYDDYVVIDGNHPLAGKDLIFDIEVLEIM